MKMLLRPVPERLELQPVRAESETAKVSHITLVPARAAEVIAGRLVARRAGHKEFAGIA